MAKLSKYIWPLFAQCGYLDDALDKLLKNVVYILFHTHSHRLLDTGVVGTTCRVHVVSTQGAAQQARQHKRCCQHEAREEAYGDRPIKIA
jgi:hypothetical protein